MYNLKISKKEAFQKLFAFMSDHEMNSNQLFLLSLTMEDILVCMIQVLKVEL